MIAGEIRLPSSHLIAAGRLGIAGLFALWVLIDPAQPVRDGSTGAWVLAAYLAWASALLLMARNWWIDFRIFGWALLADCLCFFAALYFTQSGDSDLVSPFMAFFVFIILSAAVRRGWRFAMHLALLIALMFVLMGLAMAHFGLQVDISKFIRRATFMELTALLFVWFAYRRNSPSVGQLNLSPTRGSDLPFDQVAEYARRETEGTGVALAWRWHEEPLASVWTNGNLGTEVCDVAPDAFGSFTRSEPHLFDLDNGRALVLSGEGDVAARPATRLDLADRYSIRKGLFVPLRGTTGCGELVVTGMRHMSVDHLAIGVAIGREIASSLDEDQLEATIREATANRVREDIARDLHDSVSQSLAGAQFRIAGLKRVIENGQDPREDLETIGESLRAEQEYVREVIRRLRENEVIAGSRNLLTEVSALLQLLSSHWAINAGLAQVADAVAVPTGMLFNLQQLIREAVANAVRHGGATEVRVGVSARDDLVIAIEDNGTGFAIAEPEPPRSIDGRAMSLGGKVSVQSEPGRTRVVVRLPFRSS